MLTKKQSYQVARESESKVLKFFKKKKKNTSKDEIASSARRTGLVHLEKDIVGLGRARFLHKVLIEELKATPLGRQRHL